MSRLTVTTEVNNRNRPNDVLAKIRRLEALAARAWPAKDEIYDGVWVKRETSGIVFNNVNCVVPLDPDDDHDIANRVKRLCFENGIFNRPLRLTPLAPLKLFEYLQQHGWSNSSDVTVMALEQRPHLVASDVTMQEIDIATYAKISARHRINNKNDDAAMQELLGRIKGNPTFLQFSHNGNVIGNLVVVHDFKQAGLIDFSIRIDRRGRGLGKAALQTVLGHLLKKSSAIPVQSFWVEVETQNSVAWRLFDKAGFKTVYHCQYWRLGA